MLLNFFQHLLLALIYEIISLTYRHRENNFFHLVFFFFLVCFILCGPIYYYTADNLLLKHLIRRRYVVIMDSEVFVSSLQKTNLIAILCTGNTTDRLHLLFVFFRLEALKWKPTKELKKKRLVLWKKY